MNFGSRLPFSLPFPWASQSTFNQLPSHFKSKDISKGERYLHEIMNCVHIFMTTWFLLSHFEVSYLCSSTANNVDYASTTSGATATTATATRTTANTKNPGLYKLWNVDNKHFYMPKYWVNALWGENRHWKNIFGQWIFRLIMTSYRNCYNVLLCMSPFPTVVNRCLLWYDVDILN